jgi:hypothetical protein
MGKIVVNKNKPKNWETLQALFGVKWGDVIVAYYPEIHCAIDIEEQKVHHEAVHLIQQKDMGVENWWAKYINDKAFRLEQEVQAYKAEIQWIKDNVATRNERRGRLNKIYDDLSSYIYGNLVTWEEAKLILS